MAVHLPTLTIRKDSAVDDIKSLLRVIKPDWDDDKIVIKTVTGGYSCHTYFCSDGSNNDGVTVRARRLLNDKSLCIMNRQFEEKIVQVMSDLEIMAKLHAIFENGYCYQYIEGKSLFNFAELPEDPEEFKKMPFELIAKNLAKIHSVKIDGENFTKSPFFDKIEQTLELYPEGPNLEIPTKEELRKLFDEIVTIGRQLNAEVGLCHGDPHPGNMVYNKEAGKVTFVDWEITHIGYLAFDVGYFLNFLKFSEFTPIPGLPSFSKEDSDKIERDFISTYLKRYVELNNECNDISDKEFNEFRKHVKFFQVFWGLYGVILMGPIYTRFEGGDTPVPDKPTAMINNLFKYYNQIKDTRLKELGFNLTSKKV